MTTCRGAIGKTSGAFDDPSRGVPRSLPNSVEVRPETLPLPASLSRFWMGLGRLGSLINSRSKGAKDKGAIPETALKSKGTLGGDEPYGDSPRAQLMDFSGGE